MNKIMIEVPMLVPRELTPNRPRGIHWYSVHKMKVDLQTATYSAAWDAITRWTRENQKAWLAFKYATINFHFHVRDRRFIKDDDNVIAGAKYMIDVLQRGTKRGTAIRVGIIENDKNVKIGDVNWYLDGGDTPWTVIEVIEMEGNGNSRKA
jgi:hypothetical protein